MPIDGSFTEISPIIDGWTMKPTGWLRGMTWWVDNNSNPQPATAPRNGLSADDGEWKR